MHNMTDDDLFQKGLEIHDDPTWDGGWMRGGRPVTNAEMAASMYARIKERSIRRHEEGCCGLKPLSTGRCPDGGICQRRLAATFAAEFFRQLMITARIDE